MACTVAPPTSQINTVKTGESSSGSVCFIRTFDSSLQLLASLCHIRLYSNNSSVSSPFLAVSSFLLSSLSLHHCEQLSAIRRSTWSSVVLNNRSEKAAFSPFSLLFCCSSLLYCKYCPHEFGLWYCNSRLSFPWKRAEPIPAGGRTNLDR